MHPDNRERVQRKLQAQRELIDFLFAKEQTTNQRILDAVIEKQQQVSNRLLYVVSFAGEIHLHSHVLNARPTEIIRLDSSLRADMMHYLQEKDIIKGKVERLKAELSPVWALSFSMSDITQVFPPSVHEAWPNLAMWCEDPRRVPDEAVEAMRLKIQKGLEIIYVCLAYRLLD